MTTMILAVMSRASLGHTGRELKASRATTVAFVCVTVGAVLRVAAPLGFGGYTAVIDIAGLFWGAGLLAFAIAYAPVLWGERVGDS